MSPSSGAVLFSVQRAAPGTLSTMAAPPRQGLEAVVRELAGAGTDVLVCLLGRWEQRRLGLGAEPDAARAAGLDYRAFPIRDFSVPDAAALTVLVRELAGELASGRHVVVHCRGGVGRSSLVAAAVLVHEGATPDDAWAQVAAARGGAVPETRGQGRFLTAWAAGHDPGG